MHNTQIKPTRIKKTNKIQDKSLVKMTKIVYNYSSINGGTQIYNGVLKGIILQRKRKKGGNDYEKRKIQYKQETG